jgi:hypothetical protein
MFKYRVVGITYIHIGEKLIKGEEKNKFIKD